MKPEERHQHYYNDGYNAGCVKGYEQGYEDAINKACKWFEENVADIWNSPCNPDKIVELFRKAMKGGKNE